VPTAINTDTHLGIFFATALASGLTNALALVVAMTYGVMEPGLKKLAWVTLFASVAGIPAASSWIVYRSVPGVAYALMSRYVCSYIGSHVLSAATGSSWLSKVPCIAVLIVLLGWLRRVAGFEGPASLQQTVAIYEWTHASQSVFFLLSYAVAYFTASASFTTGIGELPWYMRRCNLLGMKGSQNGMKDLSLKILGPMVIVMLAFVGRGLQTGRGVFHNDPFRLNTDVSSDGITRGLLAVHSGPSSNVAVDSESLYGALQGVYTIRLLVCASVVIPLARRAIKRLPPTKFGTSEVDEVECVLKQGNHTPARNQESHSPRWCADQATCSNSYEGILSSIEQARAATVVAIEAVAAAQHRSPGIISAIDSEVGASHSCRCALLRREGGIKVKAAFHRPSDAGARLVRCSSFATGQLRKTLKLLQGATTIPGLTEIDACFQCPCGYDVSMHSEMPPSSPEQSHKGRSKWRYRKLSTTLRSWLTELQQFGELSRMTHGTVRITLDSNFGRAKFGKTEEYFTIGSLAPRACALLDADAAVACELYAKVDDLPIAILALPGSERSDSLAPAECDETMSNAATEIAAHGNHYSPSHSGPTSASSTAAAMFPVSFDDDLSSPD
jgi:hypothetical protein